MLILAFDINIVSFPKLHFFRILALLWYFMTPILGVIKVSPQNKDESK